MADRRFGWIVASAGLLVALAVPRPGLAQGPTMEEAGMLPQLGITTMPGSLDSLLGMLPGSSGTAFGSQPGRDDLLLGRIGSSAPRVPTAITMPGGTYQGPQTTPTLVPTQRLPAARPLLYGAWLPALDRDEGPPDGLRSIRRSRCSCTETWT